MVPSEMARLSRPVLPYCRKLKNGRVFVLVVVMLTLEIQVESSQWPGQKVEWGRRKYAYVRCPAEDIWRLRPYYRVIWGIAIMLSD